MDPSTQVVEKHQYAYEPAVLYCLLYFYFVVNGGGLLSIDALLSMGKGKEGDGTIMVD